MVCHLLKSLSLFYISCFKRWSQLKPAPELPDLEEANPDPDLTPVLVQKQAPHLQTPVPDVKNPVTDNKNPVTDNKNPAVDDLTNQIGDPTPTQLINDKSMCRNVAFES